MFFTNVCMIYKHTVRKEKETKYSNIIEKNLNIDFPFIVQLLKQKLTVVQDGRQLRLALKSGVNKVLYYDVITADSMINFRKKLWDIY